MLAAVAVAFGAQAATVTSSASKALTATNWTDSLSLSQFDASLGTLTGVQFNYSGAVSTMFMVEALNGTASVATFTSSGRLIFSGPFSATLNASNSTLQNLSAFDGDIDFGGTSGATIGPLVALDSGLFNVGGSIASYIGSGTFNVGIAGNGLSGITGAGNQIAQINTRASADVQVTYVYTPTATAVPEPMSLALVGVALFGAGVATRKRKAA